MFTVGRPVIIESPYYSFHPLYLPVGFAHEYEETVYMSGCSHGLPFCAL